MSKIKKIFMALILIISFSSFSTTVSPKTADAAIVINYCDFYSGNSYDRLKTVVVEKGNKSWGGCHIGYYHLHKVGSGSTPVNGTYKSQFNRNISQNGMANLAASIISQNKIVKSTGGKYKAEGFDISQNQYVRVIYQNKKINGKTYKSVTTMFPIKNMSIK